MADQHAEIDATAGRADVKERRLKIGVFEPFMRGKNCPYLNSANPILDCRAAVHYR